MSASRSIQAWFGDLGRWERWALAAWALMLFVVCTRVFVAPHTHNVYPIFANAARNWLHGDSLYGTPPEGLDHFRYSPAVAGIFVPLGVVPDRIGSVLWRVLSAVLSLAALAWWGKALLPATLGRRGQLLLWLLVFPACVANLHNGQSNPLVLALLLAAVAGAAEERWNLAAVCIAVATLFKVYPLALGLLLAALYPRRFAGRFAVALGLGLALPLVMQSPAYAVAQYADWFGHLRTDDREALILDFWPRDLRLLCRVWLGQMPAGLYPLLQVLAGAEMAGLCFVARRRVWSRRRLLALLTGLACCWMTVLGPATESSTYVLLAPSLGLALLETWNEGRPRFSFWGLAVAYTLLLLVYVLGWLPGGKEVGKLGLQPLAGLLTLVCLVVDALHAMRPRFRATISRSWHQCEALDLPGNTLFARPQRLPAAHEETRKVAG